MKWRKLSAILLILSIFVTLTTTAGASESNYDRPSEMARGKEVTVKVMSFNIRHGVGMDGVLDLERIASVIRDSGADIVGLQEVDRHYSARSDFEDQAKKLAEALGMHYRYAANLDRDPLEPGGKRRQYGTAVLSKYPIIQSQNHLLSSFGAEQRGLLETTINVKGNHVQFYTTHLGLTLEQRLAQIDEILAITGQYDRTTIITGDFNADPASEEINLMKTLYQDGFSDQNDAYTFPANLPRVRIDYIFLSESAELLNKSTIPSLSSDHLPIIGDITLKREAPFNNGR
ncbi:endonuclease/exonuclease/phosphatase family protein [Paenibacillus sp. J2TS4]|uniref:endonuclease/exonuclease/phosphatase family protein n=1 Tax=Paenibacillus sp. J2TS4 TaxID=2807194 RepID=UPI001B19D3AA|nr:endonuclease/exonuclease/phosphatase family protein [Paenibacillus sp. J2TS4]GIP35264.1 metal-dependent hydrolase [Paenibacillus sp. J2TS4]